MGVVGSTVCVKTSPVGEKGVLIWGWVLCVFFSSGNGSSGNGSSGIGASGSGLSGSGSSGSGLSGSGFSGSGSSGNSPFCSPADPFWISVHDRHSRPMWAVRVVTPVV